MRFRLLGAAAALAASACSTAPVVVPPQFSATGAPAHRARIAKMQGGACALHVSGVRDTRHDPDYLGNVAGRPVVGTHLGPWLASALQRLLELREDTPAGVSVDVEVLKAYMSSLNVAKSADIVVRARFRRGETLLGEETLRGAHTSANWASGDNETLAALAEASRELAVGLRAAADRHCLAANAVPEMSATP